MDDWDPTRYGTAPAVRAVRSSDPTRHESAPEDSGGQGRRIVLIAIAWAVLVLAVADTRSALDGASTTAWVAPPPLSTLEDTWAPSTPEDQGIDSSNLADLVERAAASGWIDSVTVVRHGAVVLDTVIFPFPEDVGHSVGPSTHSVMSTLVGILLDRGLLPSVDIPVAEILARGVPPGATGIDPSLTVEHLLTMSSGIDCGDTSEDLLWSLTGYASEPGTRFELCDRTSALLAAVVASVTGQPVADFATEALFEPLGITDFYWPERSDGELTLLPIDMAKIGHLYLRAGMWDDEQIVSADWIGTAMTPHIQTFDSVYSLYGYGWYIYSGFVMSNRGDQSIVIVPELDLVVVFTSGLPPTRDYLPEALTTQYMLAAISPDPAPADAAAQERLDATVTAASLGPEPGDPYTPDLAEAISDVRFVLRSPENANGWFRIRFDDAAAVLEHSIGPTEAIPFALYDSEGPAAIEIGLNGRFVVDEDLQSPAAWRAEWRDGTTLAIDYRIIGDAQRGTLLLSFEDERVRLQLRNTTAGTVHESIADRAG